MIVAGDTEGVYCINLLKAMSKIHIGKQGTNSPILAYNNALLCYVYGRVTLNSQSFLFLLPSIFYLFHQAIEVSIKTLLKINDVKYYDKGMAGHRLYPLLKQAVESRLYSERINDLIKNKELIELLKAMDDSYLSNKYDYAGYSLIGIPLRDLVDNIVCSFFEEINLILKSKNHALAVIHVPVDVEQTFLLNLKTPITYCVIWSCKDGI